MRIEGNTPRDVWLKTLDAIRKDGSSYSDHHGRTCRELLNVEMFIKKPTLSSVAEPIDIVTRAKDWVYPSKDELSAIMFRENQNHAYEHTYGSRIFNFYGAKDQMNDFIIPLLKKDPQSRQAVLNIYNPLEDSDLSNRNIPALIYLLFRIKEDALHLTVMIRSNDILIGWPANIYQLFKVQEYLANELEMKIGSLTIFSNSAHYFLENNDVLKTILD